MNTWLKSLVATGIGAIAGAGVTFLTQTDCDIARDWKRFLITMGVTGLVALLGYLAKSPLPEGAPPANQTK